MNINNVKKVIFDLDGVILNTDTYHYKAWFKLLKDEFNIEIEKGDKDLVRGISRPDSLTLLLKKYNIANIPEAQFKYLLKVKNDYYLHYLDSMTEDAIFPGFYELSQVLKEKNIKMIIASASHNANFILSKLKIVNLFDGIVDVDSLTKSKPDPEIFLNASKLAGESSSEECIVIEDAQAGIDAGKAAKIFTIAFNTSGQKLYNYDIEVKSHAEIIDLIK